MIVGCCGTLQLNIFLTISREVIARLPPPLVVGLTMTNSVRKLLSPYLFAVYPGELSVSVYSNRSGITIGNRISNHPLCTDDLRLLGPALAIFNLF